MSNPPGISKAPVYATDRSLLNRRLSYNFRDYGFEIPLSVSEVFEVVPTIVTEEECFLFLFPREDIKANHWSLLNLHVFLKRKGSLEEFAHSLGESVKDIALSPQMAFKIRALGYSRNITMGKLFKGGEAVVSFIGGEPDRVVRDSHFYFGNRHAHCYTGLLHLPGEEAKYDALRARLFELLPFID